MVVAIKGVDERARKFRSDRWQSTIGCLMLILLTCWFWVASLPETDPEIIDAGYVDGRPVADAIRNFADETGSAPDSIEALIPKYLTALPKDAERFQYSMGARSVTGRWMLTFWENKKMFSFVPEREGLWLTGDYDEHYPSETWTRVR